MIPSGTASLSLATTRIPKSEFVAGRLCLSFCNTIALSDAADRFADSNSFARWAERAGYHLSTLPSSADLAAIWELRDHLRLIFGALAKGKSPDQTALDQLTALAPKMSLRWNQEMSRAESAPGEIQTCVQLKDAIVNDAIDVLINNDATRIKQCPASDCCWFFLDTSKNGKRRWCAMSDCGVKDKVRRYRRRHATLP